MRTMSSCKLVYLLILMIVLVIVLPGCKSETASRTYNANADTVWAASIDTVKKLSGAEPVEANRQTGKITSAWITRSASESALSSEQLVSSNDYVKAYVTVQPAGNNTKVSVQFAHRESQQTESGAGESGTATVSLTAKWDSSRAERIFFDQLSRELSGSTTVAK